MNRAIHPTGHAALNIINAGRKYRPSNGTEGEFFLETWCHHCARDKSMREGVDPSDCDDNEVCLIIGRTFVYDIDHAEYPIEWQFGKDGQPCCTAFVPAGQEVPAPRCEHTLDMFKADKSQER
jgi:hypothetical protein